MLAGAKAAAGLHRRADRASPTGPPRVAALGERLRPGDVVLVKASRAAGLQTVALALRRPGGGRPMRTILVSAGVALLLALFGTPLAIRLFSRRGYGQLIREEGPAAHATKRGTPTMGGTVIVIATLVGYVVGHLLTSDPMPTVRRARARPDDRARPGRLPRRLHQDLQAAQPRPAQRSEAGWPVGRRRDLRGARCSGHPDGYALTPADPSLSFLRDFGPALGVLPFVIWIVIMIGATSNAVNLTDGLDGLATGAAILVLAAYVLIANWQLRNDCTVLLTQQLLPGQGPARPRGRGRRGARRLLRLPVVERAARAGSSWATPARSRSAACWPAWPSAPRPSCCSCMLGGLFVIITLSVMIQVGSFKLTGRRVFKMAPLQHHFELIGWAETTIVIRFWLIAGPVRRARPRHLLRRMAARRSAGLQGRLTSRA